jgi:DNA mismatch repair protein MutL
VPRVLTFDAVRAATLADHLDLFSRIGFDIEPFGDTQFALRAAPAVLRSASHADIVADAVDELADAGQSARVDDAIDAVLLRMACHGSIRAGDAIAPDEVHALFRQLDAVDFGANCPHGRPVYFRMGLAEIETRFSRR